MLYKEWDSIYAKYIIKDKKTLTYIPDYYFKSINGVTIRQYAQRFTKQQAIDYITNNDGDFIVEDAN